MMMLAGSAVFASSASAVPLPVILSGAGQHGRSRKTSNTPRVLVRSFQRLEASTPTGNQTRHSRGGRRGGGQSRRLFLEPLVCAQPRLHSGSGKRPPTLLAPVRYLDLQGDAASAPHEDPQDIGGPSTPPMLPRSAQDDREDGTALALGTIRFLPAI